MPAAHLTDEQARFRAWLFTATYLVLTVVSLALGAWVPAAITTVAAVATVGAHTHDPAGDEWGDEWGGA